MSVGVLSGANSGIGYALRPTPLHNLSFPMAASLAKSYDTPLVAFFASNVHHQYTALSKALPSISNFYYAVKSNPYAGVLKALDKAGSYFDVATPEEIYTLQRVGVGVERMFYTHPIKKPQEITAAYKEGLRCFVVDNVDEIRKVAHHAPHTDVMIRLAVNNPDSQVNLSFKFGAHPADIPLMLDQIARENLNVVGFSFHAGSQNPNPQRFVEGIVESRKWIEYATAKGFQIRFLNIGGGFPFPCSDIFSYCEPIRTALCGLSSEIQCISEPGRFFSASSMSLIVSVVGRSYRHGQWWYYIDDGVYGALSGHIFDFQDYAILSSRPGPLYGSVIAGPTCDSRDVLRGITALPKMELGDLLIIPDMGSYSLCSATRFNGYDISTVRDIGNIFPYRSDV